MANEEHLKIIRQGADVWNEWREKNRGLQPNLSKADLFRADLTQADLRGADLREADLVGTQLIGTDICYADLTGSSIYGISAWDVRLDANTRQENLIITLSGKPAITVDNVKVAQFIYLLLNNKEIRDVIDTIGRKGVLLLGRFTEGRVVVLERLREELRKRDFVPMVFNFDKPEVKDFTETVRLLASLSHFVIADITKPKSTPLELQAVVPECMVPFVPILERGEKPFAMFTDLWIKYREWVFDPISYPSVDRLIEVLDTEIVRPAQAKFADLLARKAEKLRVKDI
jgi:Pentapeptide repeats (8 copies)